MSVTIFQLFTFAHFSVNNGPSRVTPEVEVVTFISFIYRHYFQLTSNWQTNEKRYNK